LDSNPEKAPSILRENAASSREGAAPPYLAILVLNYNRYEDTMACLKSILEGWREGYEVIVVDNGSSDSSLERLRAWAEDRRGALEFVPPADQTEPIREEGGASTLPRLVLLCTGRNLGFAGGNNFGIRYALARRATWVLLLNNDTVVEAEALTNLVEGAERAGADLAGCSIYEYDRPTRPWFLGGVFNWWGDRTITSPPPLTTSPAAVETDWITGCCLLVRREVFEKIGLLDARAFMYYEDGDFCWRAAKAGLKRVVVLNARIRHKVTQFMVTDSPFRRYHGTWSRIYFHRKHRSAFSHAFFLVIFALSRLVRSLVWLLQGRRDLISASWCALWDSRRQPMNAQSTSS